MSVLQRDCGLPIERRGQLVLLGLAGFLMAGFLLAASLEPDPRGYGTHQRLGLPPCTSQLLFGRPCPGCGMTTCFALFVRGRWLAAGNANPAGLVMATSCAFLIPWCLWSAWQRRLAWVDDPWSTLAILVASWSGLGLMVWLTRWW